MEIDQLWSSAIAGACTGGILSALARTFHQLAFASDDQHPWTTYITRIL